MSRKRELKKWRNQKSKFKSSKIKKTNSKSWLLISLVGFAVLSAVNNLSLSRHNYLTGERRSPQTPSFYGGVTVTEQSLLPQSFTFPSSQYQPLKIGSSEDIKNRNFTEIDRLAADLNYQGESIEGLADLLAQYAYTDLEKARIIYAWITQHISYDVPAFKSALENGNYPDVSAKKVLRDRTTICSGYSNLYFALASAMDLEAVIIFGYAKGATTTETDDDVNHAWNGVKINGGWYLLDATWGSGSVIEDRFKSQYKPYYFATKPSEFIYTHFPRDKGWQLLNKTYSRSKFASLPHISSHFYDLQLQLVNHHIARLKVTKKIDIVFQAPANVFAVADLYQRQQKLSKTSTFVTRKDNNLVVSVAPPASGEYTLKIYAKEGRETQNYQQVITYQIEADKSVSQFPKTYGHYSLHQVNLIEPLESNLPDDRDIYFSLKVPRATDVRVLNTQTNQWTALESYGDYFQGYVNMESGQTIVVAKFPEDDRYWRLLEYK